MAPETTQTTDCPVLTCTFAGCEATFKRKDRLRSHLCTHEGTKPFKCSHNGCVKSYTNSAGLKRHEENTHNKYNADGNIFICSENGCAKVYKSTVALKKHMSNEHEKKSYECTDCSKRFYKHQQLKIHEFEHTGIKPFVCTYDGCEKRFLLPSKLKAHQKYHQGYSCKVSGCEQKFEKWTLLQKHVKLDHVPELKCDRCNKVFRNKSNLRTHAATHDTNREIFLCPYDGCPRFFCFEKNLNHHVSSTHEGKKHACTHEGCDKEFKHKINLRKHLKLHDPNAPLPQKKKRKCRKRRSMAAHISGYKPSLEEDLPIITKNDENETVKIPATDTPMEELPQVILAQTEELSQVILAPTEELSQIILAPLEELPQVILAAMEELPQVILEPTEELSQVILAAMEELPQVFLEPMEVLPQVVLAPCTDVNMQEMSGAQEISAETQLDEAQCDGDTNHNNIKPQITKDNITDEISEK